MNIPLRWSDNTKELAANLKQGLNQIEATKAAAEKMAKALSGDNLIKAARNLAAGIEKIGGVSKLTAAEQERVNTTITKAIEKYRVLGQTAPDALIQLAAATKRVEPPTSALGKVIGDLQTHIVSTAAGFLSANAIMGAASATWHTLTGFVSESVKSYAAAEASASKLTTALRQQGTATPAIIGQYDALSQQFQKTTVFSDDLITEMQALLVQVGNVMPSQMKGALTAATNLSAGLGIDLEQATQLVAKAAAGHTETLGRYGITVDKAALKTQGLDAVLTQINKQFGGQAAAQIDTYAGRVEQLANNWDNVKEAVGKAIVNDPLVAASLRLIGDAASAAADNTGDAAKQTGFLSSALDRAGLRGFSSAAKYFEDWARSANDAAAAQERLNRQTAAFRDRRDDIAGQYSTQDINRINAIALEQQQKLVEANEKAKKAAEAYAKALEAVNQKIAEAEKPVTALSEAQQKLILHFKELGLSNDEIAMKMRVSTTTVNDFTKKADEAAAAVKNLKETALSGPLGGLRLYDASKDVEQLQKFIDKLRSIEDGTFRPKVDPAMLTGPIAGLELIKPDAFKPLANGLKASLMDVFKDLPNTISSAFTGGGGVLGAAKALGTQFGSVIGESVGTSFAMAGKAVGSTLTGLASLAGPVGAAIGSLVGPLIDKLINIGGPSKEELAGRDVVARFEAQFSSVEDMIEQVGAAYVANGKTAEEAQKAIDKLWKAEKQGAEATKKALEEINAELEHHNKIADEASSKFGPSKDELKAQAEEARDVFEFMRDSGQYTAEQIEQAFVAMQEALAAAGDEAAKAWVEAHKAATKASSDAMSAMEKDINDMLQRKSELEKRVGAEAKEEEMGVNEKADREELARLDDQLQQKADEYAQLAKDTGQAMADAIVEAFKNLHIVVPIEADTSGLPGTGLQHDNQPGVYTPGSTPSAPGASRGAHVTASGLRYLGQGGPVLPRFMPRGTDIVPAMLTPGELVLTVAQQGRLADALMVNAQTRSQAGGGEVITVGSIYAPMTVTQNVDRKQLAEDFKEVLAKDATVYEAVRVVAKREVAGAA